MPSTPARQRLEGGRGRRKLRQTYRCNSRDSDVSRARLKQSAAPRIRSAATRCLALTNLKNIRAHALIVPFPLSELVFAVGTGKGKAALNCVLETELLRWL